MEKTEAYGDMAQLFCAQRSMEMLLDEALSARRLGRGHFRVLSLLRSEPRIPVGRVAVMLDQTDQAVWKTVRVLQARDLVKSEKSSQDGRVRLLSLTAAGRREEDRLAAALRRHLEAAAGIVGKKDWQAWRRVMDVLGEPCRTTFG